MSLGPYMDAEWRALVRSHAANAALAQWSAIEPTLDGFADLDALQAAVHDRANPQRGDTLLAALVRLAAVTGHNDLLATRVVLQLLIPGAIRLSGNLSWIADRPTSEALVLGELTAQIRTYPWQRRPRQIAANLLLDTRQRLTRTHHRTSREVPSGLAPHSQRRPRPGPDDEDVETRITAAELLRRTRRDGTLTTDEEQVLVGLYLCDLSATELATATGRSRSSVYAIRQQAHAKLRQAAGRNSGSTTHTVPGNDHRDVAPATDPRPGSAGMSGMEVPIHAQ